MWLSAQLWLSVGASGGERPAGGQPTGASRYRAGVCLVGRCTVSLGGGRAELCTNPFAPGAHQVRRGIDTNDLSCTGTAAVG
eukprot:COSAG01_NODE_1462_length_10236_cov_43.611226_2_plen_82_part_00